MQDTTASTDVQEIPTFTGRATNYCRSKPTNVFACYILQIINSTLIARRPCVYKFRNVNYSYVKITGTVISRKYHTTESVSYIVADETGCMSCIAFPNDDLKVVTRQLEQLTEKENNQDGTSSVPTVVDHASNIVWQKCVNKLQHFPTSSNINLGDKVTVMGQLKEKDERMIIVWSIEKHKTLLGPPHFKDCL